MKLRAATTAGMIAAAFALAAVTGAGTGASAQSGPATTTSVPVDLLPLVGMNPVSGRPGTPYTVSMACAGVWEVTVTYQFGDTVEPVPMTDYGGGSLTGGVDAGTTDATYRFACDGKSTTLTFDVENAIMVFTPPDGDVPDGIAGTDCDAGEVEVEILVGFRPAEHVTVPTDANGDWATDLPPDADRLGVYVNASCGDDFVYETLERNMRQWYETTTTTAPADPGTAPPAIPVPGTSAYTG